MPGGEIHRLVVAARDAMGFAFGSAHPALIPCFLLALRLRFQAQHLGQAVQTAEDGFAGEDAVRFG